MKTVTNLVSAVGEIVDRLTLPGREKKQLETDILQLLIAVEEKTITEQAATIQELEQSGGGAAITEQLEAAYQEGVESNG